MKKQLTDLKVDETAILHSFNETTLSGIFINDLLDYGLLPGAEIRMLHKSPSQNKVLIGVGMAEISLREKDAQHITVESSLE